jgi:hypothetical protein
MALTTDRPALRLNPWWYASALALIWLYYWTFEFLYVNWAQNVPWNRGPLPFLRAGRITNAILILLAALAWPMSRSIRLDRAGNGIRRGLLLIVLGIFFAMHVSIWGQFHRQTWFWMEDVARTTLKADQLLLHGQNPYAAPIDREGERLAPGTGLDGYKYLPVTMAAYFPCALWKGNQESAVITTNLIYSIAVALILAECVRRWVSLDAALVAMILFFMPRIISEEELSHGCNDIVPMIPLMLAFLCSRRRFTCGLLVGLAISAKLLPGMLWIPVHLSPKNRGNYFAGIGVGLLPSLFFLVWNVRAFVGNIFVFNTLRPTEMSSLFYGLGIAPRLAFGAAVGAFFCFLVWKAWNAETSPLTRCAWAVNLGILVGRAQ